MSTDINRYEGRCRTDMYCTECGKDFIAEIDYSVDGNHIIVCPLCGHLHHRVVQGGRVTEDRHGSGGFIEVKSKTWAAPSAPIGTSSASAFLRRKWLEKDG
jgi:DNA-directed RNA polymerase subunit RPC12/RpoP